MAENPQRIEAPSSNVYIQNVTTPAGFATSLIPLAATGPQVITSDGVAIDVSVYGTEIFTGTINPEVSSLHAMPDGEVTGQLKQVMATDDNTSTDTSTITPVNFLDGTSILLAPAEQDPAHALFQWQGTAWRLIDAHNHTVS